MYCKLKNFYSKNVIYGCIVILQMCFSQVWLNVEGVVNVKY